jgi:hypothetical protein
VNCYVCESAGAIEPAAADAIVNGKGVCRFHTSDLRPREPLQLQPAQKPEEGETSMPASKALDIEAIKADRASGLSFAAIAQKHGCGATTVRAYLMNGAKPERPAKRENGPARPNGYQVTGSGGDLADLNGFLNSRFQSLPLAAKVRLLVDHAAHQ